MEIGALHTPLKVFNKSEVLYLDRMSVKDLRKHYPELRKFKFIKVDIVDDGENLNKIKTSSVDFVIANHFIEHCENPIGVLKNHLRVLRKDGIIYWAVPDKRYTFDNIRQLTSNEHLEKDFKLGPQASRRDHYEEWVNKISTYKGKKAFKEINVLIKNKYSIHFHVWTMDSFRNFLIYVKRHYNLPFRILEITPSVNEFIVVLKKV